MKTRQSRRQIATVSNSRWLAYAAAGAATALAGSNSAEAAIHYSGLLQVHFPPDKNKIKTFPLDQAGDFFQFNHFNGWATFYPTGIISASFWGGASGSAYLYWVSRLRFGQQISAGYFTDARGRSGNFPLGIMAYNGCCNSQWLGGPGVGYVGFSFNGGAGVQYGWARVRMVGEGNAFSVLDYAYADPGEPIRAGQISSGEQAPDQGSLGWLALGAVGLLAWRKSRSRTAS